MKVYVCIKVDLSPCMPAMLDMDPMDPMDPMPPMYIPVGDMNWLAMPDMGAIWW